MKKKRSKAKYSTPRRMAYSESAGELLEPILVVLSTDPTPAQVQQILDKLARRQQRTSLVVGTEVPPTEVPPTEVPPTEVPPTEVPPTEVPPTEVPPTEVPPTPVPPQDIPLTTHFNRADWFGQRFAYPFRETPKRCLDKPPKRPVGKPLASAQSSWHFVGPDNISGRVTCLALVNPPTTRGKTGTETPGTLYAGTAGGGVWRSDDSGRNWKPLWDERTLFPILSVGALAVGRKEKSVVLYAATGEANLSSDNHPGNQTVYASPDGGDTWVPVLDKEDQEFPLPRRIGTIAVDPTNASHIFIGGVCHLEEDVCGIFEFDGTHWQRHNQISANNYYCHSIAFGTGTDGKQVLFAGIDTRGNQSGIWRYETSVGWQQLADGLPPGDQFARTTLAVSGRYVYALASDRNSQLLGLFRSQDCGDTWVELLKGRIEEAQMSYNNCIAVHPLDPNYIIWGGTELRRTKDGGRTWQPLTDSSVQSRFKQRSFYVHQDHHALLLVAQNDKASMDPIVYDGNDGGVSISYDGGNNWEDRGAGLAVTMFYDVDVAPTDKTGQLIAGGTQDNGAIMTGYTTAPAIPEGSLVRQGPAFARSARLKFSVIIGGDGGWVVFDPRDAAHFYASAEHIHIYRKRVGRHLEEVTPRGLAALERQATWMTFIAMDPHDPNTVFAGSNRVWRTLNDGQSWQVSPDLDGSPVSAIEIATADRRRIYVGTENGGFFRSLDGGDTWSRNMAGPELPGRIITRIEAHPTNEEEVYITVGSYATTLQFNSGHKELKGRQAKTKYVPSTRPVAFAHVFRSANGGQGWESADTLGQLPNVPHLALAFETVRPYRLFVAGDTFVHIRHEPNPGEYEWLPFVTNLPSVVVTDLVYHRQSSGLVAATYGRGLWATKLLDAASSDRPVRRSSRQ